LSKAERVFVTNAERPGVNPVALLGGTFDPVHYGHLRCAEEVRKKLDLANLYLLPAGSPPHRDTPEASVKQRLEMLQLACLEFPHLLIDDRETRRSGPSYMADTLQEVRAEFPNAPILLLIGQDAVNLLHTWFDWKRLFELAHIVVLTRPGTRTGHPPELAFEIEPRFVFDSQELCETRAGSVLRLEVEPIDVSATDIKRIIRSGHLPMKKTPASVVEYISKNRLYLTA
jgi:nicotinate-nucleotide adenylyltransferase